MISRLAAGAIFSLAPPVHRNANDNDISFSRAYLQPDAMNQNIPIDRAAMDDPKTETRDGAALSTSLSPYDLSESFSLSYSPEKNAAEIRVSYIADEPLAPRRLSDRVQAQTGKNSGRIRSLTVFLSRPGGELSAPLPAALLRDSLREAAAPLAAGGERDRINARLLSVLAAAVPPGQV